VSGDLPRDEHRCDVALLANATRCAGKAFLVLVMNDVTGVVPPRAGEEHWDVLVTATKKYDLIRLPEEG
jgi:hypothetical protein